jgi:hypothetical protein
MRVIFAYGETNAAGAEAWPMAVTTTDSSGDFKIDLPLGTYSMAIPSTNQFTYVCRRVNEVTNLPAAYSLQVGEYNRKMSIGLMQGFLSFPEKGIDWDGGYYDRDPRKGYLLAWNGSDECTDNDSGTHFLAEEGDTVPSFAPGTVTSLQPEPDNWVVITTDAGLRIGFAHNSEVLVKVGDRVSRYQPIAKAGRRGHTNHTLIHLGLDTGGDIGDLILDPYKPKYQQDPATYGGWTITMEDIPAPYPSSTWRFLPISNDINWQNYWIVEDQTQYGPPYI